ncbi:hypothetical protein OAD06_04195 [Flavobacteriaceae bacterium]|nr:hypothetical protein [Flavobacteriaceae bacterium]
MNLFLYHKEVDGLHKALVSLLLERMVWFIPYANGGQNGNIYTGAIMN